MRDTQARLLEPSAYVRKLVCDAIVIAITVCPYNFDSHRFKITEPPLARDGVTWNNRCNYTTIAESLIDVTRLIGWSTLIVRSHERKREKSYIAQINNEMICDHRRATASKPRENLIAVLSIFNKHITFLCFCVTLFHKLTFPKDFNRI